MAHDASNNNPVKELMSSLLGIVLLLAIILGIAIFAWMRPAGDHGPVTQSATPVGQAYDELLASQTAAEQQPAPADQAGEASTDPAVADQAAEPAATAQSAEAQVSQATTDAPAEADTTSDTSTDTPAEQASAEAQASTEAAAN